MNWPTCDTCDQSILRHYLRGHIAYCDATRETRAPFRIADVLLVRRTLGIAVSDHMRDLERREQQEAST